MVWILMASVALNAFLGGFIFGVLKAAEMQAASEEADACGSFEVVSGGGWGQAEEPEDGDFSRKKVGFKH